MKNKIESDDIKMRIDDSSYYKQLGFERDPFSPSPDPLNFIPTQQQQEALDRLDMAIRNRDGLAVVSGDVGTGKTTMSRILHSNLTNDDLTSAIMLDPTIKSEFQFLRKICNLFAMPDNDTIRSDTDCLSILKSYLVEMYESNRIITLIIDEGQDLRPNILRRIVYILNFELNIKLINIVIFAQLEFAQAVKRNKRFENRIELRYYLNPLTKAEALKVITERISISGGDRNLFTDEALDSIVNYTDVPRTVIQLCRNSLRELIWLQRPQVDRDIVERVIELSERF